MRRRGFTKVELIVLLGVIVVAAAILRPTWHPPRQNAYRAACQSNLKQIALAIKQYQSDWNEKYPLTAVKDTAIDEKNPLGWADAVSPYVKSNQIFSCRLQIKNGKRNDSDKKPSDRDYTDYFYNRRLAGIEDKKLTSTSVTILLGEGNDGTDAANARYSLSTLPAAWRKDKTSPLYRHLDGANYAFADGHVKWIKPDKITDKKPGQGIYTFAIQ